MLVSCFNAFTLIEVAGAATLTLSRSERAVALNVTSENTRFGGPELRFGARIVAMLPLLDRPSKVAKKIKFLAEGSLMAREARQTGSTGQVVIAEKCSQFPQQKLDASLKRKCAKAAIYVA
jgi:hypothetical protein